MSKVKTKTAGKKTDAAPGAQATPIATLATSTCPCIGTLRFNFPRTGPTRGTMGKLAEAIGCSETMLSLTLAGKKLPPVLMLVKMARVLSSAEWLGENVTVDQILRSEHIAARVREELKQAA